MGWVAGIEEVVKEVETEVVFILWTIAYTFTCGGVFCHLCTLFTLRYCAPNLTLGHAPYMQCHSQLTECYWSER